VAGNPLLLVQLPKVAATTPALVAPTPKSVTNPSPTLTNLTSGTASFIVVNGQPPTAPTTPATLPQAPGTVAANSSTLLPGANLGNPLPPILQGATVVPPAGPLTFADLQTITTNFIGGGHHEPAPGPTGRSFNPPSTPRPLPSASPTQESALAPDSAPAFTAAMPPRQTTEAMVPLMAGFEEEPQLIGDQTEEVLQQTDGSVGLRVEVSAVPVIAAALAAHWADRHRRPEDDEE